MWAAICIEIERDEDHELRAALGSSDHEHASQVPSWPWMTVKTWHKVQSGSTPPGLQWEMGSPSTTHSLAAKSHPISKQNQKIFFYGVGPPIRGGFESSDHMGTATKWIGFHEDMIQNRPSTPPGIQWEITRNELDTL